MDFFFKRTTDQNRTSLSQGDILDKTGGLKDAIREAHPFYAKKADYTHFMVLTQSCDLVRRPKDCNARYITICAMRPLSTFTEQQIAPLCFNSLHNEQDIKLVNKSLQKNIEQKLERLLNNTEPGYFFIRAGSHPRLQDDTVAYLRLSIALNVKHYDVCFNAKIAELEDAFQAKVGWLVGNEYSRVGTKDITDMGVDPDVYKSEFIDDVLGKTAQFLTNSEYGRLRKAVKDQEKVDLFEYLKKLERDDDHIAGTLADEIIKTLELAPEHKKKIRNTILSNRQYSKLFS